MFGRRPRDWVRSRDRAITCARLVKKPVTRAANREAVRGCTRHETLVTRHRWIARGCRQVCGLCDEVEADREGEEGVKLGTVGCSAGCYCRGLHSRYTRGETISFMTSRALRYSPTLSQSCRDHKVNIRHQRAARANGVSCVSILPRPAPLGGRRVRVSPFGGARNALTLVGSRQSVRWRYCAVIVEKSWGVFHLMG